MRSVIFKNIPYEILADYRVSEEPVLRRALRRRAYALYRMLNARCFGNELPKHPQIVVCGSSDDSLIASSRAWYTKRRRVYARICVDPEPVQRGQPGVKREDWIFVHEVARRSGKSPRITR
jgi:hypothetical protein